MENFAPSSTAVPQHTVAADRVFAPGVQVIKLHGAVGRDDPINEVVVRRAIDRIAGCRHIHLDLCSTGGSVDEADKIFRLLRSQPVPISARASRKCLSAAVTIYLAADLRIAAPATEFLLHPVSMPRDSLPARVNAESLRAEADRLAEIDRREARLCADRTGHTLQWFLQELENEDLLSPADAVGVGLVHEFEGLNGPALPGLAALRAGSDGNSRHLFAGMDAF